MTKIPCPGDHIRLMSMLDDPDPIQPGQVGTVLDVSLHGCGKDAWHQINVAWNNGRTLMLVVPPDRFEFVEETRCNRH